MDIFGSQFNATNIKAAIDFTNVNYGGFGYSADKVCVLFLFIYFFFYLSHLFIQLVVFYPIFFMSGEYTCIFVLSIF